MLYHSHAYVDFNQRLSITTHKYTYVLEYDKLVSAVLVYSFKNEIVLILYHITFILKRNKTDQVVNVFRWPFRKNTDVILRTEALIGRTVMQDAEFYEYKIVCILLVLRDTFTL